MWQRRRCRIGLGHHRRWHRDHRRHDRDHRRHDRDHRRSRRRRWGRRSPGDRRREQRTGHRHRTDHSARRGPRAEDGRLARVRTALLCGDHTGHRSGRRRARLGRRHDPGDQRRPGSGHPAGARSGCRLHRPHGITPGHRGGADRRGPGGGCRLLQLLLDRHPRSGEQQPVHPVRRLRGRLRNRQPDRQLDHRRLGRHGQRVDREHSGLPGVGERSRRRRRRVRGELPGLHARDARHHDRQLDRR